MDVATQEGALQLTVTYSIAEKFTRFPGPRYHRQGPNSGEVFRDEVLIPMLSASEEDIMLELDGTNGYGSSFLDESFGGLMRKNIISLEQFRKRVKLQSTSNSLLREIEGYMVASVPAQ